MIRRIAFILAVVMLTVASSAWAHEHKVMATVTMAASDHIMANTADGKEQTFHLMADTQILRGTQKVKAEELKKGTRVVITVTGDEEPFQAREIRVGAAAKPAK